MKRINHLRGVWHEFNSSDFGGRLTEPTFLIHRANKYDGKIYYRSNRYEAPFDTEKVTICISDKIFGDWAAVYGTLLHEMIHQYQLQILKVDAPHDSIFGSIARHLENKYNYPVR